MGKKMKLSLDDLKVQSFVTSLETEKRKVRGGRHESNQSAQWYCTEAYCGCFPSGFNPCTPEGGGGGGTTDEGCTCECVPRF